MHRLSSLPLLVILMGIGAAAMYLPAFLGLAMRDWEAWRAFFYGGTLFLFLTVLIAMATAGRRPQRRGRSHLLAMLAAYLALPVMLAVPFQESVGNTSFLNAYFEMVSSITTTGATLFDIPARLTPAEHLWRALVAWLGGFLLWLTALAILAPMNLGGFEVTAALGGAGEQRRSEQELGAMSGDPQERLIRFAPKLFPVYGGLTAGLWLLLLVGGEGPFVAICHAMSTMASSGISPVGGMEGARSGIAGEIFLFFFFLFAISRQTFMLDFRAEGWRRLRDDLEFRIGLAITLMVTLFLFARHWLGAYEVSMQENLGAAFSALWGSLFTVLSFLSTTGFVSADWSASREWSGLQTPGMILLGLAVFGGGVATTAGGVKLLRIYALYKHGLREMEKLIHPSSVGGAGAFARRIRRQGAYIAWLFFMMFALSVALVMVLLSAAGLNFESSMVLTVAALTTTGPLAGAGVDPGLSYAALGDGAKMILCGAMVLGRLETLVIVALFNPEFWRN
ncbi:trk system potassium uptake protein TrkH [Rhodovulum imhoffii]|uniref:Trk system potassium uptake protein TrkH n=1 Tax=Rhodovulum imhoffii TaxID=365340 RepID=A0A2T5BTH8_9RHOB|nr:potassium transporter TrkG [Rhodovulum imhoffii]MBK5932999.1 potassium transporter TrkH [Rhodovulum imhoffii]PTN02669.1 trk system potassium uptake protein TrkH [Rhodovulum imhoffii]